MGVTLCDESDIKARFDGRDLTTDEQAKWPGRAAEATVQVEGFVLRQWDDLATVPLAIRIVTSRMTVRSMTAPTGGAGAPIEGQSSASSTFGPMSYSRGFGQDAVFTSPWLSKADKAALAPYISHAAVYNEAMYDTTLYDRTDYDFSEPGWSSP